MVRMERLLMNKLGLDYESAQQIARAGRENLCVTRSVSFSDELERECVRLFRTEEWQRRLRQIRKQRQRRQQQRRSGDDGNVDASGGGDGSSARDDGDDTDTDDDDIAAAAAAAASAAPQFRVPRIPKRRGTIDEIDQEILGMVIAEDYSSSSHSGSNDGDDVNVAQQQQQQQQQPSEQQQVLQSQVHEQPQQQEQAAAGGNNSNNDLDDAADSIFVSPVPSRHSSLGGHSCTSGTSMSCGSYNLMPGLAPLHGSSTTFSTVSSPTALLMLGEESATSFASCSGALQQQQQDQDQDPSSTTSFASPSQQPAPGYDSTIAEKQASEDSEEEEDALGSTKKLYLHSPSSLPKGRSYPEQQRISSLASALSPLVRRRLVEKQRRMLSLVAAENNIGGGGGGDDDDAVASASSITTAARIKTIGNVRDSIPRIPKRRGSFTGGGESEEEIPRSSSAPSLAALSQLETTTKTSASAAPTGSDDLFRSASD